MSHRVADRPQRYWTASKVFGATFLWFYAFAFITAATHAYLQDKEPWALLLGIALSSITFLVPIFGYTLRKRPEQIRAPRLAYRNGDSAILFPADRPAVPVSAALYAMLSGMLVSWGMVPGTREVVVISGACFALAALFFSYTLFAILGRFHDDGTYLHRQGVTIRARGLRAEIPWASIAGSRTYKTPPFPYPRIALDLIPGATRDVRTTVPWWIGSPRPRKNTVFLTTVQVPALDPDLPSTNPGEWIDVFAQTPPTPDYLDSLTDPPSLYEARIRSWEAQGMTWLDYASFGQ